MTSVKTRYACKDCGYISSRWLGRCPDCGQWNSMLEETSGRSGQTPLPRGDGPGALPISLVPVVEEDSFSTGIAELDRVLGNGVVPGSLILLGGDPGIGKSTLLIQAASRISESGKKVLYVSGEESAQQVRLRASRLGIGSDRLYLLAETDIDRIESVIRDNRPETVILDSIQAVYKPDLSSSPGGVSQVRECAAQMMRLAKTEGIAIFLVGHVTKEGALAGPRVLEHMVDTVLYFEGDRHHSFRILRGVKNRFGSTNEIGIFQMESEGLKEIINPSEMFMANCSREEVAGSVVVSTMEGSRPLLVEIQALVCSTGFGTPRRMTAGVDFNRVSLILAVLEKRVGLHLGGQDSYVNAVGGVKIDEPAADLGIALALTSSFREKPVGRLAAVGEIGLTGEIRPVPQLDKRITEASRLGFTTCLVPGRSGAVSIKGSSINILRVETLEQAIEIAMSL
ncbi:MAG: DNA repair protein RadA [Peptococcaceae bacterium BICA1-7]|nr:MAG: DNA repair protein RadA [Peptococcaceae bacterium BICA1-7]HBV98256.1 DNA repair protein RadA [Desulfotomaculum sp.]